MSATRPGQRRISGCPVIEASLVPHAAPGVAVAGMAPHSATASCAWPAAAASTVHEDWRPPHHQQRAGRSRRRYLPRASSVTDRLGYKPGVTAVTLLRRQFNTATSASRVAAGLVGPRRRNRQATAVPWLIAVAVPIPIRPVVAMVVRHATTTPTWMPAPAAGAGDLYNGRVLLREEVRHHRSNGNRARRGCQVAKSKSPEFLILRGQTGHTFIQGAEIE